MDYFSIYTFSNAFQLSGSILLLLDIRSMKQAILEKVFHENPIPFVSKDNTVVLSEKQTQKIVQGIVLNIFALLDLVIGYSMTIFAHTPINSFRTLICMFFTTALLIFCESMLSKIFAKIRGNKKGIHTSQLPDGAMVMKDISEEDNN